jgi:mevalonate kinase
MEETLKTIVKSTTQTYLDYGVLGSTIVILLVVSSVLLWFLLKDRDSSEKFVETLENLSVTFEHFLELQAENEKHNKALLEIVSQVNMQERQNTKECYEKYNKIVENQNEMLLLMRRLSS